MFFRNIEFFPGQIVWFIAVIVIDLLHRLYKNGVLFSKEEISFRQGAVGFLLGFLAVHIYALNLGPYESMPSVWIASVYPCLCGMLVSRLFTSPTQYNSAQFAIISERTLLWVGLIALFTVSLVFWLIRRS